MFAQILTRKNSLVFLFLAMLVQQGSLSALFWTKTLPAAPVATAQTFQLESPLYHTNVPLSWEWSWNNFKKNSAWSDSYFFGIPRDAKEAQEMLTVALKNNCTILKWSTIISGGLLLASAALWWYEKNQKDQEEPECGRNTTPIKELRNGLALTSAAIFFGTLYARSWYTGKLKELSLAN